MVERKRLTASDWTAAALDALGRGGLAAVAVEPIAARLGTTKGSFYWHFSNRDALLEAALLRWERVHTEEIIALVDTDPDPHSRLRHLMTLTLAPTTTADRPGHRVLLALQASASHPLVAPVFARVTQRRLDYVTGLFTASGFPPEEARRRSLLAYTAYLGHTNLADASPELVPVGAEQRDYVDAVVATLTRR
ncbi:TetR/AcrR family transcriptional regulator [Pseudonocardia xinjiangensis]|uniref:TetR/AcrR family transcriptional regulator n=1 Tax=Pseudonocardia xinjiangensis TaxID=75289 RepID=A0ABX1RLV1_9PSEU|nr:TetR/AcrR family transcriptional regulator [Pseudonocardia xinjiangensis]NMH80228.1 TetR/AcrR family transcriptional regulator [Pseudonocardia xinjiangensis]